MITLAAHNAIGTHKSLSRCTISCTRNQECFVISTKPILTSPTVIKIIMTFPPIRFAQALDILAVFAYHNMTKLFWFNLIVSMPPQICIASCYIVKQWLIFFRPARFLVVHPHIVSFYNVITAQVK